MLSEQQRAEIQLVLQSLLDALAELDEREDFVATWTALDDHLTHCQECLFCPKGADLWDETP